MGNADVVATLLKHGANRRAKTASGVSAEAIARSRGFTKIVALLQAANGT